MSDEQLWKMSSCTVMVGPVNTDLSNDDLTDRDASLSMFYGFELSGGYEYGDLLFIDPSWSKAHWKTFFGTFSDLKHGDVLLTVNGHEVSGMLAPMVRRLICQQWSQRWLLELKVIRRENFICPTKLAAYLGPCKFAVGTFEHHIQEVIRPHVYSMFPPATSRPPKKGEVHGDDYYFFIMEKMRRIDETFNFLEKGICNGTSVSDIVRRILEQCRCDVSNLRDDVGRIYYTLTCPKYPGNIVPASRLDAYISLTPPVRSASSNRAIGID